MVANPSTNVQLMSWIVLNTDQKRDSVTSDLVPATEGLSHIVTKDYDSIDARCYNYQKRVIARDRLTTKRIQ